MQRPRLRLWVINNPQKKRKKEIKFCFLCFWDEWYDEREEKGCCEKEMPREGKDEEGEEDSDCFANMYMLLSVYYVYEYMIYNYITIYAYAFDVESSLSFLIFLFSLLLSLFLCFCNLFLFLKKKTKSFNLKFLKTWLT